MTKPRLSLPRLGIGGWGATGAYGVRDPGEAAAAILRAVELGVTLVDTADVYGWGENERFLGSVLSGRWNEVVLSAKIGFADLDNPDRSPDGRPDSLRRACDASLRRLGVEKVDLLLLHRVDPQVPIEESFGALAGLVEQGKATQIGLSEADLATVLRADREHPVAVVQSEYSLWTRDPERDLLPGLAEAGVAFVAYSPLGRGFLTAAVTSRADLADDDWRRGNPRFDTENLRQNLPLLEPLRDLAARRGATAAQIALAWVLAQEPQVTALFGTTRLSRVEENAASIELALDEQELAQLNRSFPLAAAHGERYGAPARLAPPHLYE